MAQFQVDLSLPHILYHGTQLPAIQGIKHKAINSAYWKESKDFGSGFYTTIDLFQAARWARKPFVKAAKAKLKSIRPKFLPAIAILECDTSAYTDLVTVTDFRGECPEWVRFILSHRLNSKANECECPVQHPGIVCGLMADNNTGNIVQEFIDSGKQPDNEEDFKWFWERIVRTKNEELLNGLQLGDQIAFFDERLNSMLQLKGYYLFDPAKYEENVTQENYRQEWKLHDAEGKPIP